MTPPPGGLVILLGWILVASKHRFYKFLQVRTKNFTHSYRFVQVETGAISIFAVLFIGIIVSVGILLFRNSIKIPVHLTSVDAQQPQTTVPVPLSALTADVFAKSDFSGPFLVVVTRTDGSYSYAVVDQGGLVTGDFDGDVTVHYSNGDYGIIKQQADTSVLFMTKKGTEETVFITYPLIAAIRLPDGTMLPVEFTDATIRDGALVGAFRLLEFADQKQVTGYVAPRGELSDLTATPTLTSPDPGTAVDRAGNTEIIF